MYDLATGNYSMYMRRREPDTLEVQQMKSQREDEMARKVNITGFKARMSKIFIFVG